MRIVSVLLKIGYHSDESCLEEKKARTVSVLLKIGYHSDAKKTEEFIVWSKSQSYLKLDTTLTIQKPPSSTLSKVSVLLKIGYHSDLK